MRQLCYFISSSQYIYVTWKNSIDPEKDSQTKANLTRRHPTSVLEIFFLSTFTNKMLATDHLDNAWLKDKD